MVAHGGKWAGDAVEQLIVAVYDGTGFAVHQPRRADDLAAERLANRLVTQAYPENRDLTGEGANEGHEDPGLCGRLRTGRQYRSEEHTSELQSHSDLVCR